MYNRNKLLVGNDFDQEMFDQEMLTKLLKDSKNLKWKAKTGKYFSYSCSPLISYSSVFDTNQKYIKPETVAVMYSICEIYIRWKLV